jgi:hypothetical protein
MHFPPGYMNEHLNCNTAVRKVSFSENRIKIVTAGVPHSARMIVLSYNEHHRYTTCGFIYYFQLELNKSRKVH